MNKKDPRSRTAEIDHVEWTAPGVEVSLHPFEGNDAGDTYNRRVRILLISTYELGRQPVHLASPAAALRSAGHAVDTVDTSVEPLEASRIAGVDAVAISVPMHTAMRLALPLARSVKEVRPELPIAFYGLYAAVGHESVVPELASSLFAGEYERLLVEWADSGGHPMGMHRDIGRSSFGVPDRAGLSSLSGYARLEWKGQARLAAAVEASHGCRHRCRHCPIPVLYDGRLRLVGKEAVVGDIDRLEEAGVEHITFADPDFLNAPRYSLDLIGAVHDRHPHLTFDATVKVSHILDHASIWPDLAGAGLLFVVSAFESVDERTLDILDKGHTVSGMRQAVDTLRAAGIFVRPTWLPFFPWTTVDHVADIARFIDEMSLWPATDPVQLAIRLLVPNGSLLAGHPEMKPHLREYRPEALTWHWDFADPCTGDLQRELDSIAAEGSDCGAEAMETLETMRDAIAAHASISLGPMPRLTAAVPRLTESWFCCAEPTTGQATAVGLKIGPALAGSRSLR
jgi:hypothetical protein